MVIVTNVLPVSTVKVIAAAGFVANAANPTTAAASAVRLKARVIVVEFPQFPRSATRKR